MNTKLFGSSALTSMCLLIVTCSYAQTKNEQLRHILDTAFLAHPAATGIMASVISEEVGTWTYAVGVSNKTSKTKLRANQPVLIASNTKTYISAAILRLNEQKKLDISDAIGKYLPVSTLQKLSSQGYETGTISISNLLSHTSGIRDYVDDAYFDSVNAHPRHRWTRTEQIDRAMQLGKPLALPGDTFKYADVNYLLLTEIVENVTKKPFYESVRQLDRYNELELNATWFNTLEPSPSHTPALAHQYWNTYSWDSYDLDPSWDLFGGGGIAATPADLALFFKYLFEGKIIKDTGVLSKMHTSVPYKTKTNYCLGIRKLSIAGLTAYYHGGFWGTDAIYFPELKTAICIVVLEKSERDVSADICKAIVDVIKRTKEPHDQEPQLSTREVKVLIDTLERVMNRSYLYPDKARLMTSSLKMMFKSGAYNNIKDKASLCHQLQIDLQHTYKDRHLEITYDPGLARDLETYVPDTASNRRAYERELQLAKENNFAFRKAEILPGNIGYVRLDGFFGFVDEAKPTVDGVFQFVRNTKALIIDMRNNTGGSPEMVLQIQSYFFNQKTPMNYIIDRSIDTIKRWTDPAQTDFKLNMPVYILTSRSTFSGGEDFCYGLKYARRVTIVGDTTGGGSHVTRPFSIGQGCVAFIPGQRAFNMITKTDWDGTGVWPDTAVSSELALIKAQGLIYEELSAKSTDEREKSVLHWLLVNNANKVLLAKQMQTDSVKLTKQELIKYCGEYYTSDPNPIKSIFIVLKGSRISRRLDNGSEDISLVPISPNQFVYNDDTGCLIEFERNADGQLRMILQTPNGNTTRIKKN